MQPTATYCHCGEHLSYLADGGFGCRRCDPALPPGRQGDAVDDVLPIPRSPLSPRYLERMRRSRRARAKRKTEGG